MVQTIVMHAKYKHPLSAFLLLMTLSAGAQKHKDLHQHSIVIDTHNDFPSAAIEKKLSFEHDLRGKTHSDLDRMFSGGVDIQIFSIFCGPEQSKPYEWANREIDSVHAWVARNPQRMMLVKNSRDLRLAVKQYKLGAMLGVEGGHMMAENLENLHTLYDRGVRYMTLTWNNSTSWASSALDETTRKDSVSSFGLNELGIRVVKKMNELGMIIDVSHNGEKTFWDVIRTSTKPVIASHSSVFDLCPHRRNLKNDQILAIARNGGVIHLNFYAGFLDSNYEKKSTDLLAKHQTVIDSLIKQNIQPDYAKIMVSEKLGSELISIRPPMSVLLDHLDHIVRLAGVDHVGLGSDFDGIEAPPGGLNGVEDFPKITKALIERGYSKKDIRKILGGNFMRVLKANEN
jgi:membrane dipeptidase